MSAVAWRYALTNALMVAFVAALAHGGWPVWALAGLAILIGGAIDEAVGDEHEHSGCAAPWFFDLNLYATLPLLAVITLLLLQATLAGGGTVVAAAIGAGYFYALAGVTVAHELTHRVTSQLALMSARALLAFTLNPTFESYHLYGHHRNVGSWHDPATARRGEYVLASVARTVVDQSVAGWRLEAERLRRKGVPTWSWHNRVLGGLVCSLVILAAAATIAGAAGMLVFLAAAVFGRISHEMVNYVQHYGLVRADGAPIEMRHAVNRIDDGYDAAEVIVPRDGAVERERGRNRPGIRNARRLDHDARERRKLAPLAPKIQALERFLQRVAECAADASGIEQDHTVLASAVDQHVIESHFAELVDDDRGVRERRIAQQVREQRGLAAAQVPGQHVHGRRRHLR